MNRLGGRRCCAALPNRDIGGAATPPCQPFFEP